MADKTTFIKIGIGIDKGSATATSTSLRSFMAQQSQLSSKFTKESIRNNGLIAREEVRTADLRTRLSTRTLTFLTREGVAQTKLANTVSISEAQKQGSIKRTADSVVASASRRSSAVAIGAAREQSAIERTNAAISRRIAADNGAQRSLEALIRSRARAIELETRSERQEAAAAQRSQAQAARSITRAGGGSSGLASGIGSFAEGAGGTTLVVGTALASGIAAVVNEQREFQTTMQQLRGNMELTDQEFAQMTKVVIDLGKETGASFGDIGAAYMRVSNFGFKAAETMKIVEVATKSAIGSGADMEKTADLLASVMHTYGIVGQDALKTQNLIHESALMGNMTLEEFAERAKPTLAIAAELHVSLKDALAGFVSLSKGGQDVAQSATQFRAIMVKLVAPTKATTKEIDALKKATGIDLTEAFSLGGLKAKGFANFIDQVKAATVGHEDAVLKLTAAQRGGLGLLRLVTGGYDDMAAAAKRLNDVEAGKLDPTTQNFNRQQKTLDGTLKDLSNELKAIADERGPGFLNFLTEWIKSGSQLADVLDRIIDRVGKMVPGGGGGKLTGYNKTFADMIDPNKSSGGSIKQWLDQKDELDRRAKSPSDQIVSARNDIDFFKKSRIPAGSGSGFIQTNGQLYDRLRAQLGPNAEISPAPSYEELNATLDKAITAAQAKVDKLAPIVAGNMNRRLMQGYFVHPSAPAKPGKASTTADSTDADDAKDDAAEAARVIASGRKDAVERVLEEAKKRFQEGKGKDTDVKIITDLAGAVRDADLKAAQSAYDKESKDSPKTAAATLKVATQKTNDALADFKKNDVPTLTSERNKKLDESVSKQIENRIKDYETYGPNASEAQRKSVLAQVAAMQRQLRTTDARTSVDEKLTAAKKSVDERLIESTKKAAEIIDKTNEVRAQMSAAQSEADIALLKSELEDVKDPSSRGSVRKKILDAENARIDAEKAGKDAEVAKTAAGMYDKKGGLTHDQAAQLDAQYAFNENTATTAKDTAARDYGKGTKSDTLESYANQAKFYRDKMNTARTPGEKADLSLNAGQFEVLAAGPITDQERQAMVDKNLREEMGYRSDDLVRKGGSSLLDAARTGDGNSVDRAFGAFDTAKSYSPDDQTTLDLISREVKMILDATEAPGSKIGQGDNRKAIVQRLNDLESLAYGLGDVPLTLSIDADVTRLDAKLKMSADRMKEEFEAAISSSISSGVDSYTQSFLDVLAHSLLKGRDPYGLGPNGRKLTSERVMQNAGADFLKGQATGLQKTLGQRISGIATSSVHGLFARRIKIGPDGQPMTDADGNPITESTASNAWNSIKNSGAGKALEESAQKAANFLHLGGKDAGTSIAEGAAVLFTGAEAISAAMGGKGKKRKYGGLIGEVVGGIAGSFIGGPAGGWKAGAALGGAIGGQLGFAAGGNPPVGKDVWVGERGPERVRFMSPAHVYPNTESRAMASNSGNSNSGNTNHFHGPLMQVGEIHDKADADRSMKTLTDHLDAFTRRNSG